MNTYPRAIDVTCPKCLARPGRTCSRLDGSPMVRSHRERHQRANRVYHKAQKKPAKRAHLFITPTPPDPHDARELRRVAARGPDRAGR